MKAIVYNNFDGIEEGKYLDVDDLQLKADRVLVKIFYAGIIPFDVKVLDKIIPMPHLKFPFIPGAEFSGLIVRVGDEVKDWKVGDYVCANPKSYGGAFAEFIQVKAEELCKIPDGLAIELAAACPVSSLAAWHALFNSGQLVKDQKVLIVGASGNVGSFAVQFAKQAEAEIFAIASSQYQYDVLANGAAHFLDYKKEDYLSDLPELDLIIDLVGSDQQKNLIPLLKAGGKIVSLVQEPDPEELNIYNVYGEMLNSGSNPIQLSQILQWIQKGIINVNISKVLQIDDAVLGLQLVKTGKENGKVLLKN